MPTQIERAYFSIDNLEPITRDEFERVKRNKKELLVDTSHWLVWSKGKTRIGYVFDKGKYYKGDVDPSQPLPDVVQNFDYYGIIDQRPYAGFKRRAA